MTVTTTTMALMKHEKNKKTNLIYRTNKNTMRRVVHVQAKSFECMEGVSSNHGLHE